jgi:Zn/Cd-binding protein ZinT
MGIQSSAFGRVVLTGEDAKAFKRQVRYGKPNKAAVASMKRGAKLAREFSKNGYVILTTSKGARGKR